jgi:uncharacterized Zn finger protein
MATYKGRTFTSACDECGQVYQATHQFKADAQAAACYEKHFPAHTRDTKVVMDEIKRQIPDWDGN